MIFNKGNLIIGVAFLSGVLSKSYLRCPAVTDRCTDGFAPNPDHLHTLPCWRRYEGEWRCSSYAADGPAECGASEININNCFYDIKKPTCPKPTDICDDDGRKFKANAPNASPCWYHENNSKAWKCSWHYPCKLERGFMDIRQCPGLKPKEY